MSWSHTKCLGIHCLFWHMNSFSTSQVVLVYTGCGKEHTLVHVFLGILSFKTQKMTNFPWSYFVTVPLTAASFHTLISSIRTVLVSITFPALWHTHMRAGALESLRTASFGFYYGKHNGKLHDDVTGNLRPTAQSYASAGRGIKCFSKLWCHLLHFWSSSEPSPQSSEPSHTQWLEMQRWFPHSNWVDVQNLSGREGKDNSAFWRNDLTDHDRNSCFPCAVGSLKNNLVCFVLSREQSG